ncbi:hypothetical protein K504DRAFT_128879 [Pleomassaria siparia CBS 279.74]|uniref:Uncharacterized protein n=1 Tax=Pleomassaria siparia CBS 279.74 TaxID=1314801 RepID=A0A6G1KKZ3_9PLEO|nr:hypothetical protein K504DRAFT_128879 [Pleomassaria siparia CBS 279.74]
MIGDHMVGFGYLKKKTQPSISTSWSGMGVSTCSTSSRCNQSYWGSRSMSMPRPWSTGMRWKYLGPSYALIHDGGFWSRKELSEPKNLPPPDERFYFLESGDPDTCGRNLLLHRRTLCCGC